MDNSTIDAILEKARKLSSELWDMRCDESYIPDYGGYYWGGDWLDGETFYREVQAAAGPAWKEEGLAPRLGAATFLLINGIDTTTIGNALYAGHTDELVQTVADETDWFFWTTPER